LTQQTVTTAIQTERMILPLDRDYLFLGLVVSLVFVGIGFWMVQPQPSAESDAQFWGYATIIVFGLLGIVRLVQLIAPQLAFIELAKDGFRITNVLRQRSQPLMPWGDVAKVEPYQWYGFRGGLHRGVRITHLSTASETKIAVPRKYGWTADDLAALIASFRDRALKSSVTTP
jgi:hypothetical protein